MAKYISRLALVVAIVIAAGCATGPTTTNLTPAYLQRDPIISTYQEPSADFRGLQTFSVFPVSLISDEVEMNEIMEKQLLFFVRNLFEARGYRFVDLDQNPDFLVTLNAISEYKETYVAPQTVTVPRWVPGKTITSYGSSSGTINYNTSGGYSSYGWGSYSGTSTSTTYIPGYVATDTYTRSGYNVGYHYPSTLIAAYDAKTFQKIWMGTGVGTSMNPDIRISSQLVLVSMVSQFPAPTKEVASTSGNGVVGVSFGMFTPDGNNYLPTVIQFSDKSPAKQAGMELYDMILSIDNEPVVNQAAAEVMKKFDGEPGSTVNLDIWRVGERIPVTITRVPCSDVY